MFWIFLWGVCTFFLYTFSPVWFSSSPKTCMLGLLNILIDLRGKCVSMVVCLGVDRLETCPVCTLPVACWLKTPVPPRHPLCSQVKTLHASKITLRKVLSRLCCSFRLRMSVFRSSLKVVSVCAVTLEQLLQPLDHTALLWSQLNLTLVVFPSHFIQISSINSNF